MADQTIHLRIQKLIAHQRSAEGMGSVEEAQAFAAKVAELLTQYKLSMTEVELAEPDEHDPIGFYFWDPMDHGIASKRKRALWTQRLGSCVAKFHFCRLTYFVGSNAVNFVGKQSDCEIAAQLYGFLIGAIERECTLQYDRIKVRLYRNGQDRDCLRGWKESFRFGAVQELRSRFVHMRDRVVQTSQQNALIRIADGAVAKWYDEAKDDGRIGSGSAQDAMGGQPGYNSHGAAQGRDFGASVPLQTAVGTDKPKGRLS